MRKTSTKFVLGTLVTSFCLGALPAFAIEIEEVIVTARKREETSLAVPVTLTALAAGEIQRRAITSLDQLSQAVPQLQIANAFGSLQGGTIVLRGISSGESNPFADQSVSFNIDGAQVAVSSVRRLAQMDMAQVEVLKGPQALFYGKNSPGGVISIHTADPGDHFEAKAGLGYEFNARQWEGQGYVSGPINDKVGVRLAFYASTMRGWIKNVGITTNTLTLTPSALWSPGTKEADGRATVTFKPSDRFDAKFKFTYGRVSDDGINGGTQIVACPNGAYGYGDTVQCGGGNTTVRENVPLYDIAADHRFGDGKPYSKSAQVLTSLEMNYALTEPLKLTSITSLYHNDLNAIETYGNSLNANFTIPNQTEFDITQYTEELRLASSFDYPVNFLVGGYLQTADFHYGQNTFIGAAPTKINDNTATQQNHAYSAFAQLKWNIIPTVELSGGGRYSKEYKKITYFLSGVTPVKGARPKDNWHDFSPEVTLAWHPTDHYTLYGSYKQGFLSGGFNGGVASNLSADTHYDPQKIKGFEIGGKGLMADGTLRTNLSFYSYNITGLQVTTQLGAQQNFAQTITNAGKSKIYGIDFDTQWKTPVDGLSLKGAIGWNHNRYIVFNGACYRGQNQALGCNLFPNAAGNGTAQNLAGQNLLRAPDWAGTLGADYERPVSGDLNIRLSVDGAYSGSYITLVQNSPQSRMKAFWLWDSGITLSSNRDHWEVRLLGKNLFDKYYWTRVSENSFSGSAPGTTAPSVLSDDKGSTGRGREIWIKVAIRY